jgi:hypothetical protein
MSAIFSKALSDLGVEFHEVMEDILIVENFLTKEDIEDFFSIINESTEESWSNVYLRNLKSFAMLKHGRDDLDNLVAEGKLEITHNWADKNLIIGDHPVGQRVFNKILEFVEATDENLFVTGSDTLQRMYEGVKLHAHTDQDTDPSIVYASIIYLNDDYAGGELFFDNIGLTMKPKAGTLVLFPGTEKFHHGVTPVEKGPVRYVVVGFIKVKDFYKDNKY